MLRPALGTAVVAAALIPVTPLHAQVADSDGGGLRAAAEARAGLPAFALPLQGRFESNYGHRWGRLHAGIDISVLGTDRVHAALGGVVTKVGFQAHYAGYGNVVVIKHGGGLSTLYAHLASYDVRVGQRVEGGELIGRAGCTGSCTGTHLHFEVREAGEPVNPMRYLGDVARPLRTPFRDA